MIKTSFVFFFVATHLPKKAFINIPLMKLKSKQKPFRSQAWAAWLGPGIKGTASLALKPLWLENATTQPIARKRQPNHWHENDRWQRGVLSEIQAPAEHFLNIPKIFRKFNIFLTMAHLKRSISGRLLESRCLRNSNNSTRNQKLHLSPYLLSCGFQGIYLSRKMHSIGPVKDKQLKTCPDLR